MKSLLATATRAIFSPVIVMQFSEIITLRSRKKLQPSYTVQWQNLLTGKLPQYSEFSIFL